MDVVFFNRVPKTGSVQLIELMKSLSTIHDYQVGVDPQIGGIKPTLDENEQEEWVDSIANFDGPTAFASHVNFMNFTYYEQTRPIYINMVRDPVERVISWFYYLRSPWIFVPLRKRSNRPMPNPKWVNMDFDQCVNSGDMACKYIEGTGLEEILDHRRQTLFFCGHNRAICMPFNGEMPLAVAKRNVEQSYAVVGTWEDTNITLTVLENYIPRFFKGAKDLYYLNLHENIHNNNPVKPHISEKIKEMVRRNFTREIEFYQFCRQRLHKQYLAVKLDEIMNYDKSLSKTMK